MGSKFLLGALLIIGHSPVTSQLRLKTRKHRLHRWQKGPLTTTHVGQLRGGHNSSQPEGLEQPPDRSFDDIFGKCSSLGDCQKVIDKLTKRMSTDGQFGDMHPVEVTSLAHLFVGILTKWFTEDIRFDALTKMAKAQLKDYEEKQQVPTIIQSADKVFGEHPEMSFTEFAESFLGQEELRARVLMLARPLRSCLLRMYMGFLHGDTSSQPESLQQPAESPIDDANKCSSPGDCQVVIDKLATSISGDGQFGDAHSAGATSLACLFVGILTKQFTEDMRFDASTKMTKAQFEDYEEKQLVPAILQSAAKIFGEHAGMTFSEFADSFLDQEELQARPFVLSSSLRGSPLPISAESFCGDTSRLPDSLEQLAKTRIDNTIGKCSSPGNCLKVIDKLAVLISREGQFGDARSEDASALACLFVGILTKWFSEDISFGACTTMTKAQFDDYEEKQQVTETARSAGKVFGDYPEMTFSEFAESVLNQEELRAMPLILSSPLRDFLSHMRAGTIPWLYSYHRDDIPHQYAQ